MANEMKATPGPWTCFYKAKYDEWHVSVPIAGSTSKMALFNNGVRTENREADAKLIAAAPDLLAALQAIAYADKFRMNDSVGDNYMHDLRLSNARAAIEKATK